MRVSELKADIKLKEILSGKVFAINEDGVSQSVNAYIENERTGLNPPTDFIDIFYEGSMMAIDVPRDFITGYLSVNLYVKLNPDETIKRKRIEKIISQIEVLIDKAISGDYFYELTSDNFITPTTAYSSMGYSVTILMLKWHTIKRQ